MGSMSACLPHKYLDRLVKHHQYRYLGVPIFCVRIYLDTSPNATQAWDHFTLAWYSAD